LKNYKIAVIEGDGIGREVVPEGIRVLEAILDEPSSTRSHLPA
jgi:isocitrate/isopropylmalate dehydrogenase